MIPVAIRSLLFLLAAIACAIVALFVALGATLGASTWQEWLTGSLLAFYGSHLP